MNNNRETDMRIALLAMALVPLAACATGPTGDRYHEELDRLRQDCQERGGILSPTGTQSGRPNTDYVCEIRGGGGLTRD
ncbi:MAG: hypothetical protein ACI8U3_001358 [Brevundimonas sp.]|jgi:hypothetical protein